MIGQSSREWEIACRTRELLRKLVLNEITDAERLEMDRLGKERVERMMPKFKKRNNGQSMGGKT